jgi:hypothetical protein
MNCAFALSELSFVYRMVEHCIYLIMKMAIRSASASEQPVEHSQPSGSAQRAGCMGTYSEGSNRQADT